MKPEETSPYQNTTNAAPGPGNAYQPYAPGPGTASTGSTGGPGMQNPYAPAALPEPPRGNRKRLIIFGSAITLVVLLIIGSVLGIYLPNKPANVYKTGLSRTGAALSKLTDEASQKDRLDSYKQSKLTGSLSVESDGQKYSGTISSQFNDKRSDTSLNYNESADNKKLALQVMSDVQAGKAYPDVYLRVSGLKDFGLEDYLGPGIMQYDGKWIVASSDYLASLAPSDGEQVNKETQLTAQEVADMVKAAVHTTADYVFSDDPAKAVLEMKSFVGVEKVDGFKTDHYKIGVNDANGKKYCKALVSAVMSTAGYKHLPGVEAANISEDKKDAERSCDEDSDKTSDIRDFDMWTDRHTKLIHKVRFMDKEHNSDYTEFGQNYKKGSVIPMFMNYHSQTDKTDGKVTLQLDSDKDITSGTVDMTEAGDVKTTVKADFKFMPDSSPLQFTKPASATPVQDVLKVLDIDPAADFYDDSDYDDYDGSASVQSNAKDTERQTDIRSIQGQLEAYYATNGRYPSSSQLSASSTNNLRFIAAQMKGMDKEALRDPDAAAGDYGLGQSEVAASGRYQYSPASDDGKSCDNTTIDCTTFVLTAQLSNGATYIKASLN